MLVDKAIFGFPPGSWDTKSLQKAFSHSRLQRQVITRSDYRTLFFNEFSMQGGVQPVYMHLKYRR